MSERLQNSIVAVDGTLVDAMRSLERSMTQIVLVVDSANKLEGILTDGDIRRALLAGCPFESSVTPHMTSEFVTVDPSAARASVLELMHARQIAQIPVVLADGTAVGLHLLRELVGGHDRPNWAVIMAGGKGTRLGKLTESIPKPMLPVAGRPILERIVLHLVGCGIRRIFLSVGYLAHRVEEHFGDGSHHGATIEYLREDRPLGTGGSLSLLAQRPSRPLLVMNGDLVTQADIGALLDNHENGEQVATMAVRNYFHQIPYGSVAADNGELVSFREKPTSTHLINAGIYVIDPEVLDLIDVESSCSMPRLIEKANSERGRVRVFEIGDEWIDVGHKHELDRARGQE